ncbi:hypothetical protein LJC46_06120, partial [Desulfovibrio sp. OttesenSCG-928-G15]|nr:hypothetical protein [Desulfovibrio sp. OttesenSCG-928-G15]
HPCRFGKACDRQEACRKAVPVDVIAELALARMREGGFVLSQGSAGPSARSVRIWQAVDGPDGFTGLRSLSGHDREARYVWLMLLRHHLRRFLDNTGEYIALPYAEQLPPSSLLLEEAVPCAQRAVALLNLLQQQGKVLAVNPVPMMRERFVSTWKKVREALESSSRFKPLVLLWDYRTQADGLDLPAIGAVAGEFSVLLQALVDDLQRSEIARA